MRLIWVTFAGALASMAAPASTQTIPEQQLLAAAQDCRPGEVAQHLGAGVSRDPRNSGGYTPLMLAAGNGCDSVVRLLLAAGADPSLAHPQFGDVSAQAAMNSHPGVAALIRAAAAGGGVRQEAPDSAQENGARPVPSNRSVRVLADGSSNWPAMGAYSVGQDVLYSGDGGKNWAPARIRSVDPRYGYSLVNGPSGSYSNYFVVAPRREPFWTTYFVGDWRVSVPMAMGTVTDGRNVYRTVSGGMRLPPLRINADGTYTWRVQEGSAERLIRGRWEPRTDGPGVILKSAERGADWLVYNNTDALSTSGQSIIISSDCCSHYDGTRLR